MSARRFVVGLCAVLGVLLVVSASAFASTPEAPSPVTVRWSPEAQSLIFHGVLNPKAEGEAGTYEFLYKASSTECQGSTTARGLMSGVMGEEVSQHVTGLSPGTQYSVCLLARGLAGETSVGPVVTFKTTESPVTDKETSVTTGSAVLHGTLNPASSGEAGSYRFLYAISASTCENKENQETSSTEPAAGLEGEAVSSEVTGLRPNTTYTFCALASNSTEEPAVGEPMTFTTPASAPTVEDEWSQEVGAVETMLAARINPGGASTSYHMEYGPNLPYESSTPVQSVYSTTPIDLQVSLSNLRPGVLYHYRFIVSNSLGTFEGADGTFSTYPEVTTSNLPDNRGYEKVSPNNNADGNVYPAWPGEMAIGEDLTELPFEAAADGDALAYIGMPSEEGGSGREGDSFGDQYVASRGADGHWEATNVTPPSDEFFTNPVYQGFSKNITSGFLTTNSGIPLVQGAPASHYHIPYVRNFETGAYEALLSELPPNRGLYGFGAANTYTASDKKEPVFAGSSADFSHVLYMADDALTPNAIDGGGEANNLYDFHNGGLTLVNILPDGSPEPNAVFGGPVIPPDEPEYNSPDFSNVISEDGNRIFWTGQGENRNIYMREGGARTVQVDAAVGGGGQYWAATPNGSKVLFTKAGDLYEYDVANGQTTDLVPGGEVQGIVGTSEDLSYVYFVSDAVLAPGGTPGTCSETEHSFETHECGLYALHVGEPIRFIGMLSNHDNFTKPESFYYHDGDWQGGLADKEAEVTPNGSQLLFSSVRPLTGYENKETEQLFMYEYGDASLHCISCNPTGLPVSAGKFSAYLPVSHQATYSLHWMSDDGNRVFFDSVDALVPQDTNGHNDVYEWERDGTGSCESSGGCVYLLTGGTSGEGAYLIDASSTGNDVFFTTRAQLVPEDQNENVDAYDAHVGAVVPPAPTQCTGTGCQGIPSAPPVFSTPSSVTYNGVGNFAPAPKVATKAKKATTKKTKKKHAKKGKKHKRAKKSVARRRGDGHESSAHGSAASYGRSK